MRRFVVAFGTRGVSLGRRPLVKLLTFPEFVLLFGREDRPGEWD